MAAESESEKLAGQKGPFKARSGLGYHLTVKTKVQKVEKKIIQKFQTGTGTEMEENNIRIQQRDGHGEVMPVVQVLGDLDHGRRAGRRNPGIPGPDLGSRPDRDLLSRRP